MKCKACSKELRAGSKKCPYCGADVSITGMHAGSEFQWNVQDFPKAGQRQKKTNFSVDWSAGKILEDNSGKVYVQSENAWKEPEKPKEPAEDSQEIRFDRKQEDVHREVKHTAENKPPAAKKTPASTDDIFVLPSHMEMEDLTILPPVEEPETGSSLQEDLSSEHESEETIREDRTDEVPAVDDSREEAIPSEPAQEPKVESVVKPAADSPAKTSGASSQQMARFFSHTMELQRESPMNDAKTVSIGGVKPDTTADETEAGPDADEKLTLPDFGYAEKEDSAAADFKKLIDVEKNLSEKTDRVTYLSHQEEEAEQRAERRRDDLQSVPEFLFRSLEDEYEKYRRDHGIEKKPGLRQNAASSKNDTGNEVKQEESAGASFASPHSPQQETDSDVIKNVSGDMQVPAEEIGGTDTSIDRDRLHDGDTVSRTSEDNHIEEQESDLLEAMEDADAVTSQVTEEVSELPGGEITEDDTSLGDSFWNQTGAASRMTLTDIFGPEAQKFKEEWEKNSDSDLEDSIILEIRPEDIALTDDQSQAIHTISPDDVSEEGLDQRHTIAFDKADLVQIKEALKDTEDPEENIEELSQQPEESAVNADVPGEIIDETPKTDEASEEPEAAEAEGESDETEIPEAEAEFDEPEILESEEKNAVVEEESDEPEAAETEGEFDESKIAEVEEESNEAETAESEGESDETEIPEAEEASDEPEIAEAEEVSDETEAAEAKEPAAETGESAPEGTETEGDEAEIPQETPDESSGAGQKQYEDLTTMLPVDEIRRMEEESEEESEQPVYEYVYEDHEKSEEPVEEPSGQTAETANGEGQNAAEKVKGFFAAKRDERDARREERKADPQDRSSFIMKIIIAILVALVIIEFTVIGVKVLAPDSQASLFINRIESAVIYRETSPSQENTPADPAGEASYE